MTIPDKAVTTMEDELVNKIGLLFFDCQTVKAVPSDYARSAIAEVRAFDAELKRMAVGSQIGIKTMAALAEIGADAMRPQHEQSASSDEVTALRARVAQLEGVLAALRDSESVPACFRTLADAALAQPAESGVTRKSMEHGELVWAKNED